MEHKLKLGIVGLGRGFTVLLPTLMFHPRLEIIAAADIRAEAVSYTHLTLPTKA